MPTAIFATKTAFQQKLFSKNIKAVLNVIFSHVQELIF